MKQDIFPLTSIAPVHLMAFQFQEILHDTFCNLDYEWKQKDVKYYEEGEEFVFDFISPKPRGVVTTFPWISRSIELNRNQSLFSIYDHYNEIKIRLSRRIAEHIEKLMLCLDSPHEALLFSLPVKREEGKLYKSKNGIYFNSYADCQHWDLTYRVDVFLTPVISPRYWEQTNEQ